MFHSELQHCKKFNSHLLTTITQLRRNAVTNLQYSKRETTELYLVPVGITEDVLKENISKALPLTGVNIIHNDFHSYHQMKRSERIIFKFRCHKQKSSITSIKI